MREGAYRCFRIDRHSIQMRAHGDAVFVAGQAAMDAESAGKRIEARIYYTNVWVKTPQGWRFALWHACRAA